LGGINNPDWHDHRVILNKCFSNTSLFFDTISEKVDYCITQWEKKGEVTIGKDLQKLTLDILATCILGLEFDTLKGQTSEPLNAYNYLLDALFNPFNIAFSFLNKLPTSSNKYLKAQLDYFDKYCWDLIKSTQQRLAEPDPNNPQKVRGLIELMCEAQLPPQVIRDNLAFFFPCRP